MESFPVVLTIGHSTRPIEDFVYLLQAHNVQLVIDVRTVPRSKHNPQYNSDSLLTKLKTIGIDYIHMSELGGLRHTTHNSVNTGWRNASFRGYADYMQTEDFEAGINHLIAMANTKQLIIMCAEAVPWRCHRSLIEDALLVRGIHCEDIFSATHRKIHSLTSFAKVQGTRITYPSETSDNNTGTYS